MSRTRSLKVYYGHRPKTYGRYPVIRLGGKYLTQAGFSIGDSLTITIKQDRISITKHLK